MSTTRNRTRPGVWAFALVGSLGLHLGIALGVRALSPFAPTPPEEAEPVQVVFLPEPRVDTDEPTVFTELPEDRQDDEAPEAADFLSNVDSRARDLDPGIEGNGLPRLDGRSDAPHLALAPGQMAPPSNPAEPIESTEPADLAEPASLLERLLKQRLAPESADVVEVNEPSDAPAPPSVAPAPVFPIGMADYLQEAMAHATSDVALLGDISLSTTAWEYAPWLQAFRRAVTDRWNPPGAYFMGLIDGWVLAEVDIHPSGRLLELRILDRDVGHDSLEEAVTYALSAAAPYRSLPAHFPEEKLSLRIKFAYYPIEKDRTRRPPAARKGSRRR